jgi:arginase
LTFQVAIRIPLHGIEAWATVIAMTGWVIVEAPSSLGLLAPGVRRLPDALLEAGLAEALGGARRAGRVEPGRSAETVDPGSGIRNGPQIASYSRRLAEAIAVVLDAGDTPLVLGGDCSVLLGSLLSLRGRGRFGLLFADGHADFYDPASDPEAEAASMDLALASGRGPALLADLDGRGALVRDDDVVLVGFRDHDEQRRLGSPALPDAALALDLPAIRRDGIEATAREAVIRLADPELDGFWVHVDADVLDDELVPAVDYRLPGGLGWHELADLLHAASASGRVVGVDVTILNPDLDQSGEAVRGFARCLAAGLAATV